MGFLDTPGNEGKLYSFFLHASESLGTTAGQFADSIGTTILSNDEVGDATNALAHLAYTKNFATGALK